jgi:mycoredoxin
MQLINVYGADNCSDTEHTRGRLQELGVPHRYYNIEEDSMAEDRVKAWNHGHTRTPTVVILDDGGQERLVNPSDTELDAALARHGLGVK